MARRNWTEISNSFSKILRVVYHASCGCSVSEVIVSSLISSNEPLVVIVFPCPFPHSFLKVLPRLEAVGGTPSTCWCWAGVTHRGQESLPWGRKTKRNEPRPCPSWGAGTGTIQLFWGTAVRERQEIWLQQQGPGAAGAQGSALAGSPPPSTGLTAEPDTSLPRVNEQSRLFQVDWNDSWCWVEFGDSFYVVWKRWGIRRLWKLSL